MYEYECEIVRVVDGDTIDTTVSLGFDTYIRGSSGRIRLYGVDTPETRSRDAEEKKYGLAAKAFVVNFFDNADQVILKTWEKGKYGRYLGDFRVAGKWLTEEPVSYTHLTLPTITGV